MVFFILLSMKKIVFGILLLALAGCWSGEVAVGSDSNGFLKLAFVEMSGEVSFEGEGVIGCGDRLKVVESNSLVVESVERNVQTAVEELFAVGTFWDPVAKVGKGDVPFEEETGWFYNGLQHSEDMVVDSVSVVEGKAEVRLTGSLISAGTCDDPRIKEQLRETVKANAGVDEVEVFMNGETLDEWFDLRG